MSSACVGVTGMLGSAGTISQSAYVWPVHVAWVSPSMAVGFQEGTAREEVCQENEVQAGSETGLRLRNCAASLPLVTNGSLRPSRFPVGENGVG